MEKQKRWHLFLIVGVIALTIFNILPTVFYYTKPLKSPIDEKKSRSIAHSIISRVNGLENQSLEWINSYCKLLKIKPSTVLINKSDPQFVDVTFSSSQDAEIFKAYIPKAGALIPFTPSQLSSYKNSVQGEKKVTIKRKIPIHFDEKQIESFFQFSYKNDEKGNITPLYQALINDRVLELALSMGGTSENAILVKTLNSNNDSAINQEVALQIAQNILTFSRTFGENSDIAKNYFSTFSQIESSNRTDFINTLLSKLESTKEYLSGQKKDAQNESLNDSVVQQKIATLAAYEKSIESCIGIIKRNVTAFSSGKTPWNYNTIGSAVQKVLSQPTTANSKQSFSLENKNPFFDKILIDWQQEKIVLTLNNATLNAIKDSKSEQFDQILFNQIAYISRQTDESIKPYENTFEINLSDLQGSRSFLAFRLGSIAKAETQEVKKTLAESWSPSNQDLTSDAFPIWDYETFTSLPSDQKRLGLLIYSPVVHSKNPESGFKMNSIYVVAKGLQKILRKYEQAPESEQAKSFFRDFYQLSSLLQRSGFTGYPGSQITTSKEYADDYIFEVTDYFQNIIMATRENFSVHGTKRYAILEFSNVEQRILAENKIDTRIHEDLLKWRDDYRAAQIKIRGTSKYDVPKPTTSPLFSNIKLSFVKYFRGDDRKILHWGLDLSGGKTVQIELRDNNNKLVTNEADIKQGINELYSRVNKMGVSEVSIRQEGNHITLDFPGSQGLSASELVKASSMQFNIVNEKFTSSNPTLSETVNRFLQDIWNEAVVTNKKSIEDINLIAWKHLYGNSADSEIAQPRSDSARILFDNGLRLANPQDQLTGSILDTTFSKVGIFKGDSFVQWDGHTHPLIFVFNNYALEGSNLEDVRASYDPSKGNFLSFGVKNSYTTKDGTKYQPRDDLAAWSGLFSKEKISGTKLQEFSKGRGWRMAVVLNGTIVSAPTLDSPLRDGGMISGNFSQREINQLEADLKAGSLSYTPKILSEKNVSPELGSKERSKGISATVIALVLVICVMVGYYHFGGLVASVAVIFNLLIMWATLQNIQATLTLPMIAGLILTVGMAVDANVLVFERIREEFSHSGRIASAIHAGYQKAFSAILDSNVTTLIAGLVLLHFDSGPIKGFALTLIIGIVSSMFTALFMTRFFFSKWVENPSNKKLSMLSWFKTKNYNFLKHTKLAIILSSIIIVVGSVFFVVQSNTMIGMDFTGGYALNLELQSSKSTDYRADVESSLERAGLQSKDFLIRELNPANNIKLFLSRSLENEGKPFYQMPLAEVDTLSNYNGNNPRIDWVVSSLQASGLKLTQSSLDNLDANWTEVSGQMSENMRDNAIIGLLIALLGILVYITVRFEFKFAISATLCLAHDIIFTLGTLAILHAFGAPVQIDLNIIAALMTIVGYSLNDTIIIFDRIREDTKLMQKSSFMEIINHSLNVTLSRTMLTSGTTLLVLLPLIALGGSTIFGFALVMAIGVIFGTLSSLFIAAPLMHYFHKSEIQRDKKSLLKSARNS
jgi:SecD/SecF fusion protein